MFRINEDGSIYATRGDIVFFSVTADDNGTPYQFQKGETVRISIYEKKNPARVLLQKDFPVTEETAQVEIYLGKEDTRFDDPISKQKEYWYEVELNPLDAPQTIIGYGEDGPAKFWLYPEAAELP